MVRLASLLACAVALAGCDTSAGDHPIPLPTPVASQFTLTVAPPTVLRSGSAATVTVRVTDAVGTLVPGATIEVSTDAGTLQPPQFLTTDASGQATATLTSDTRATIRASGLGQARDVTVTPVDPFTMSVAPGVNPARVGVAAPMTVVLTPTVGVAPVTASLQLQCGSAAAVPLANPSSGSCTFTSAGTETVRATATTANGWTTTAATSLTVADPTGPPSPPPTPAPTLSAFVTCTTNTTLTASCNVSSLTFGGSPIGTDNVNRVEWNWGDGQVTTGSTPLAAHGYAQAGIYQLRATVTAATDDGDKTSTSTTSVTVPRP